MTGEIGITSIFGLTLYIVNTHRHLSICLFPYISSPCTSLLISVRLIPPYISVCLCLSPSLCHVGTSFWDSVRITLIKSWLIRKMKRKLEIWNKNRNKLIISLVLLQWTTEKWMTIEQKSSVQPNNIKYLSNICIYFWTSYTSTTHITRN